MKKVLIVLSSAVIAACGVKNQALDASHSQARANADIVDIFAGQEAVTGPITLGEAIARAISYNMDHRLKQMETAIAIGKYDLDKVGMLPKLVANAGYSERSNDAGASSLDLETGEQSLPSSTSQERETETSNLALTWSMLDFGLGYYVAKQSSNEILIAQERQRKTTQNITQDVIDAFWKSWMAQTLEPKTEALLVEARSALSQSRELVSRGVQNSDEALKSQAALLSTINSLIETRERISLSKIRLSALMNLKPGQSYQVAVPTSLDTPAELVQSTDELVNIALINRPELIEEDYKKKISQIEVKKSFMRLFPNISLNASNNRDENSFLVNNSWRKVGVDISWNLMNLLNVGNQRKFDQANIDLADARRQALSMAVMTQMYLSVGRYELARDRYLASSELYDIRSTLARNSAASGSRVSGMEELNARSSAIASELRRSVAFAESQAAFARIVNSAGVDLLPKDIKATSVSQIGAQFDAKWASIARGILATY